MTRPFAIVETGTGKPTGSSEFLLLWESCNPQSKPIVCPYALRKTVADRPAGPFAIFLTVETMISYPLELS